MELSDAQYDIEYDREPFSITESGKNPNGNIWKPHNKPEFIYIFVHGLVALITFKKDFFRHGTSEGPRASCTVEEVIDETIQVIKLAKEKYPELPIVMHGHSFGGLFLIETLLTSYDEIKDYNIKCAVAEAPWISQYPQRQLNGFERFGIIFLNVIAPNSQVYPGVDLFSKDLDQKWVEIVDNSPLYAKKLRQDYYYPLKKPISMSEIMYLIGLQMILFYFAKEQMMLLMMPKKMMNG